MPKSAAQILIVEDEADLLDLYQTKLIQAGHQVLIARNGAEGLVMVERHQPDLILLDILMPKLDGYTMLKKLKADKATKNIPVIIFSNLTQKEEIEKGLKLGANDYIIKTNSTPTQLTERVEEFFKNGPNKK
jgi:two-component system, OmpR family, alkaline phosphatase synthesis response regulator PhoP